MLGIISEAISILPISCFQAMLLTAGMEEKVENNNRRYGKRNMLIGVLFLMHMVLNGFMAQHSIGKFLIEGAVILGVTFLFIEKNAAKAMKKAGFVLFISFGIYATGFAVLKLIENFVEAGHAHYVSEMLHHNVHNIILYLIFIAEKLLKRTNLKQRFLVISVISCMFAMIQIVFYYYLFLSNPKELSVQIIDITTICSNAILFIQAAMLELMERSIRIQEEQNIEEKKLLKKKYEQDYAVLAEEQNEQVRMIREEIRVQLEEIQKLLVNPDEADRLEADKLLDDMEEKVNRYGRIYYCKDPVLNTILVLKQERAEKKGIPMDIHVDSFVETGVEDFDLCSIVTNLLDNAIEAVEKIETTDIEKYVQVRVGHRADYLAIQVENPVMEFPKKNKKGRFISTKKEKGLVGEHGRGLRIVQKALDKYNGHLSFTEEGNRIVVTAFLRGREK